MLLSLLLFSPSSALISSRWVESLLYNMLCAPHVIYSRLLLPASSRSECRGDRQRERESCASWLCGKLEGEHYSECKNRMDFLRLTDPRFRNHRNCGCLPTCSTFVRCVPRDYQSRST